MKCSLCGKSIDERKGYASVLGNDQQTEVGKQHIKCFNGQFSNYEEKYEED